MITYIASDQKYKNKIKEDLLIKQYFLSKERKCEILTLDEIVNSVHIGDSVILKSIWGYHYNYKNFLDRLLFLEKNNIKLINDYSFVYWNIDKYSYLSELNQCKQLKLIPTKILRIQNSKTTEDITNLVEKEINLFGGQECNAFVIKPSISASGYLTFNYRKSINNSYVTDELLKNKNRDFIIQPFRKQIVNGEVSVILIAGDIRYGIRRFPGVLTEKLDPIFIDKNNLEREMIKQIDFLYIFLSKKFNAVPKICRVDFVESENGFEIMEVEMIDPDLYFKFLPEEVLHQCLLGLCDT